VESAPCATLLRAVALRRPTSRPATRDVLAKDGLRYFESESGSQTCEWKTNVPPGRSLLAVRHQSAAPE
jgi:hypothetical protein